MTHHARHRRLSSPSIDRRAFTAAVAGLGAAITLPGAPALGQGATPATGGTLDVGVVGDPTELDPARQQQIARGAARWLEMNRGDRTAARDRFAIWRGMTDEQRANARQRYEEFRRLSPAERTRLIDVYRRYRMMPLERRLDLRDRFRELTPEQRQRLRDRRMQRLTPRN